MSIYMTTDRRRKYETSKNVTEESQHYNNRSNHVSNTNRKESNCHITAITAIMVLGITMTINVIQSANMAYGILAILAVPILRS
ncbi:MAG TPA: hypothetical protein VE643_10000 [Nitrososphaeraceae archaeon]|nr:hypothetical protein [Nitrososphaeraceae archaeon]